MNGETKTLSGRGFRFSSVDRRKELKAEFERVALPQLSQLYASTFYLTKDKAKVEDLVQETFLRGYRFFHRFKPGTNIRAWLLSIQRNLFFSRYMQKKKELEYIEWERIDQAYNSLVEEESKPESFLMSKSIATRIGKALKHLPVEFRKSILLVDVQDLKYEEAARVVKCPVGTVRSRVSCGRRLLRVALRDKTPDKRLDYSR